MILSFKYLVFFVIPGNGDVTEPNWGRHTNIRCVICISISTLIMFLYGLDN